MKILHVVPTYFPARRYGGPIESVHNLNKALVQRGEEVTVFTTAIDGPENLEVPLGVPVDCDGVKVYYFPASFPRAWFYSRSLHRALRNHARDYDLLHITSVFLSASTLGAHYAKKYGVPYVISPRGSLMKEPLAKKSAFKKSLYLSLIEKHNLAGAAAIHFTALLEEEEYRAFGFPLKKAIVVPNGLDFKELEIQPDPHFRASFGIPEDARLILFLGRVSWKKGLDTLIPAFAEVLKHEPRAMLLIAGWDDEGYGKEVEKLGARYGVTSRVKMTGGLIRSLKSAAFYESEIFALPSYAENFALTAVEAMYAGLPVLVSPHVGIAPQIAGAGAGFVVQKEPTAFAQALTRLLENEEEARAMGERGRAYARSEFSLERVAKTMQEAYNTLTHETAH